jgi:hypothetical protein
MIVSGSVDCSQPARAPAGPLAAGRRRRVVAAHGRATPFNDAFQYRRLGFELMKLFRPEFAGKKSLKW